VGLMFRCLVVDDEPLARRVIKKYIADVPWLELAAECSNAREAAAWLHAHGADVVFLDVRMPGLSGLDFLDALVERPLVILTTAYSEYALAGYDYSVVDFLLKPVSCERFMKAVNKLASRDGTQPRAKDFMFMRADREDHRVRFDEIRYLEAYGNYVKVYLDNGMILVAGTLSDMEDALPSGRFLRVHRSFVVAMDRIERIASDEIGIGSNAIPIGRSYRSEVRKLVAGRR
jgi:DNA-binding LytR/AlgR family response regulator